MLDAKLLNVNGNSLPSPLIIGTFEKRAPGLLGSNLNILNQLPIATCKLLEGKALQPAFKFFLFYHNHQKLLNKEALP